MLLWLQFRNSIFKSIHANNTNFRIGICADKTDARQLYQKIIMKFYKKQTSVWKDKIERSEAVCSTLWILSEWQSNFIFHSLLPFIKAFVLTKSMSENFVFHQKHTSVWKHNWNVWRSVLKNSNFLRLSISQSKCTFNTFLQLTRRKDHMIFWQKIAKKKNNCWGISAIWCWSWEYECLKWVFITAQQRAPTQEGGIRLEFIQLNDWIKSEYLFWCNYILHFCSLRDL